MRLKRNIKKGLENLAAAGVVAALVGTLGFVGYKKCANAPETYHGFDSFAEKGYKPVACRIDTQGDVTDVTLLPGQYTKIKNADGTIKLDGRFLYSIEPDSWFAPNSPEHTDNYGHTPENSDYWSDTRDGTVTLAQITERGK